MYLQNPMVHNMHVKYINNRNSSFGIFNDRKLKLFTGHLFSNAVKIMLFISDAQYYILVRLRRTAGSIHLFKIKGKLISEHVKLKRNIEIDWKKVNMTSNGNKKIYHHQ